MAKYILVEIATGEPVSPRKLRDFSDEYPVPDVSHKGWRWDAYTPPPPPDPTPEQRRAQLDALLTRIIHEAAYTRGWDSMDSAGRRVALPGSPWHAECVALATWADQCCMVAYGIQAAVLAGERVIPTDEQFVAEMPPVPAEAGTAWRPVPGVF